MALDRQSIEKKDFPIGRRGYDPDAVDAHLRMLADEIDELKRSARRRSESLAAAASEQVRSIVEAANPRASSARTYSSISGRVAASTSRLTELADWKNTRRSWRYASRGAVVVAGQERRRRDLRGEPAQACLAPRATGSREPTGPS